MRPPMFHNGPGGSRCTLSLRPGRAQAQGRASGAGLGPCFCTFELALRPKPAPKPAPRGCRLDMLGLAFEGFCSPPFRPACGRCGSPLGRRRPYGGPLRLGDAPCFDHGEAHQWVLLGVGNGSAAIARVSQQRPFGAGICNSTAGVSGALSPHNYGFKSRTRSPTSPAGTYSILGGFG